jgi:hypothetical protein
MKTRKSSSIYKSVKNWEKTKPMAVENVAIRLFHLLLKNLNENVKNL